MASPTEKALFTKRNSCPSELSQTEESLNLIFAWDVYEKSYIISRANIYLLEASPGRTQRKKSIVKCLFPMNISFQFSRVSSPFEFITAPRQRQKKSHSLTFLLSGFLIIFSLRLINPRNRMKETLCRSRLAVYLNLPFRSFAGVLQQKKKSLMYIEGKRDGEIRVLSQFSI